MVYVTVQCASVYLSVRLSEPTVDRWSSKAAGLLLRARRAQEMSIDSGGRRASGSTAHNSTSFSRMFIMSNTLIAKRVVKLVVKFDWSSAVAQLAIGSPGNARGPRGPKR